MIVASKVVARRPSTVSESERGVQCVPNLTRQISYPHVSPAIRIVHSIQSKKEIFGWLFWTDYSMRTRLRYIPCLFHAEAWCIGLRAHVCTQLRDFLIWLCMFWTWKSEPRDAHLLHSIGTKQPRSWRWRNPPRWYNKCLCLYTLWWMERSTRLDKCRGYTHYNIYIYISISEEKKTRRLYCQESHLALWLTYTQWFGVIVVESMVPMFALHLKLVL